MKWFLLFFNLFFLSSAFAQKLDPCLDKMINFRLMNKMRLIIRETDPLKAEKKAGLSKPIAPVSLNEMIPLEQICNHLSTEHAKSYLEMIQALDKLRTLLLKEYASTKKILPRFYQAIASGTGSTSSTLTLGDICRDGDNLFSNLGECDPDRLMLPRTLGINFFRLNAVLACQRLLPIMRQSYKRSLQCKHKKQKNHFEKIRSQIPGGGAFALPGGKFK